MSLTRADRPTLIFVVIAYALSIALSLFIGSSGGYQSRFVRFGYISMVIPTISLLLTNSICREKVRTIGWNRLPLRYLPLALFMMPVALHVVMLPVASAMGMLNWQDWLTARPDGLYQAPTALGWGLLTPARLAVRIAVNAIVGMIVVSVLALFEEIGWRAWLLPRLIERTNRRRAVVICSVIWAGWTALIAPVGIFGSGLIIGWLWLYSESLWIVAVAHGALNDWGQYAFKFVAGQGQPSDILVLGSGGLALISVGAVLLLRKA